MAEKYQVFTPKKYTELLLDGVDYNGEKILKKSFLENSAGSGNILVEAVERYILQAKECKYTNLAITSDLEEYFTAFELDSTLIEECKYRLNHILYKNNIKAEVKWDLREKDYLKDENQRKFDYIIGNPPYMMYQDIGIDNREYIRNNFISCKEGKFDYCYPFIEKSLSELSNEGKMAYLIPASIFKNKFGKNLRTIMLEKIYRLVDLQTIKVFEDALVSSAIIYFSNEKLNSFIYDDYSNNQNNIIQKDSLEDRWFFSNILHDSARNKRFGDYFKVSNSIATLYNKAFVIREFEEMDHGYIKSGNILLEKEFLKPAASPRALSLEKKEYIIFPYVYENNSLTKISEKKLKRKAPGIFKYLSTNRKRLLSRNSDKSAEWFEYGRSQALRTINAEKICVSSIITKSVNPFFLSEDFVPYSGFYIVQTGNIPLWKAMEILRSDEFIEFLKPRGINASGKSLRFSVNDFNEYLF